MSDIKKVFLIAGESSGDFHGANLIRTIKSIEPQSTFMGHGGSLMESEGMLLLEHINNLSIMGFTEVIKHLPRIRRIFIKTVRAIKRSKPDRIILIDYPGFNLKIAKSVFKLDIPVTYFIMPQVWAWKKSRINLIRKYVDQPISIFQFEKEWFLENKLKVDYFGHPLLDQIHLDETSKSFFTRHSLTIEHPIILLLPGSRQQEIKNHWPFFLTLTQLLRSENPNLQFILGKANIVKIPNIPKYIKIEENARKAMVAATVAVSASGTATLECAIESLPAIVCYKMSSTTWFIAKNLTKLKYSSIVNIIANKEILPEFLQERMNAELILKKLRPLLNEHSIERKTMIGELQKIKLLLGEPGVYGRIAKSIVKRF